MKWIKGSIDHLGGGERDSERGDAKENQKAFKAQGVFLSNSEDKPTEKPYDLHWGDVLGRGRPSTKGTRKTPRKPVFNN